MSPRRGAAASLAVLCTLAGTASAQTVPPPPQLSTLATTPAASPVAPPAAPARAASAAGRAASATAAHLRVLEDDDVRIEEVRGPRGQLQRVTVQSKVPGRKPYEIVLPAAGKDPSQARGAAGQSAWSLFDF